jgi:hypothetical protein
MPRRIIPGTKPYLIELPPELVERVKALAKGNGRTLRLETVHALERHLADPPRVETVVTYPASGGKTGKS